MGIRATKASVSSRAARKRAVFRVQRLAALQGSPLGGRVMEVPSDFGNQSFGRKPGRFFDGSPDDRAKRQDGFVNGDQINDVA